MQLPQEKRDLKYPAYFFGMALFLTGFVFLTPYNGFGPGRSILAAAQSSQWFQPGDWIAAWCSLKIMLLSAAVVFLLLCVEETLLFMRRIAAANLLILTLVFPMAGLAMGFYYLVKAIV
jgi:hypothetical protein